MKQVVKSQPTRKKLWWLLVLGPLLYIIVDGWVYPIDEGALLERTTYEEAREPHPLDESDDYLPPPPPESAYEEAENGHTHTGWDIYDQIFERIKRAWPLLISLLALKYGRKYVGDPK